MKSAVALSTFLILSATVADIISIRQAPSSSGVSNFGTAASLGSATAPQSEVQQLFENAGRQPNETKSISFNWSPDSSSETDAGDTWEWRINITNVAVPANIFPGGTNIINEQWQLQWPGGGSLESYVNRTMGLNNNNTNNNTTTLATPLCLSAMAFTLPSNITTNIAEADRGNCSAILGDQCTADVVASSGFDTDCGVNSFTVPESCMDTLGVASSFTERKSTNANSLGPSFYSDDTLYHYASPSLSDTNISAALNEAETRLNILQLQDIPAVGSGTPPGPMLCQIVSPEEASTGGGVSLRPLAGSFTWVLVPVAGLGLILI